ncbi:hypothetical protein [Mycolicibacterium stellerae]|nr:hypothetical protein [Mycolicibacterium stellerae]
MWVLAPLSQLTLTFHTLSSGDENGIINGYVLFANSRNGGGVNHSAE